MRRLALVPLLAMLGACYEHHRRPLDIETVVLVRYPVDSLADAPSAHDMREVEAILRHHVGSFERDLYEGKDTYAYTFIARDPDTLNVVHHDLVTLPSAGRPVPIYYAGARAHLDYRGTPLAGFVRTRIVFTVEPGARLELIHPRRGLKEDVTARLDKRGSPWVYDEVVTVHPNEKHVLARSTKDRLSSYVRLGLFDLESARITEADWIDAERDVRAQP